jgi:hypothetical protein
MSYPTVNQAIAKLIMEAKIKVVDDLEAALECEEEEFKAAIKKFRDSLVESEEKSVKDAGKKSKKAAKAAASSESDDSKKGDHGRCFICLEDQPNGCLHQGEVRGAQEGVPGR